MRKWTPNQPAAIAQRFPRGGVPGRRESTGCCDTDRDLGTDGGAGGGQVTCGDAARSDPGLQEAMGRGGVGGSGVEDRAVRSEDTVRTSSARRYLPRRCQATIVQPAIPCQKSATDAGEAIVRSRKTAPATMTCSRVT